MARLPIVKIAKDGLEIKVNEADADDYLADGWELIMQATVETSAGATPPEPVETVSMAAPIVPGKPLGDMTKSELADFITESPELHAAKIDLSQTKAEIVAAIRAVCPGIA